MSLKDKAKKLGAAIVFKKLYSEFKAKKEKRDEDITILIEYVEEWKANAPDDLNSILASILIKAQTGSTEDLQEEIEKAKSEYNPEDLDFVPWFESQIEVIEEEKEAEQAEE